jgi:hypothetical protein
MTILPDGRWRMSSSEMEKLAGREVNGWKRDPNDARCLIPDFPECKHRTLLAICKPCGAVSALNYWCEKKQTFVTVAYCKVCVSRGEHEQTEPSSSPAAGQKEGDPIQVSTERTNLLGTRSEDQGR